MCSLGLGVGGTGALVLIRVRVRWHRGSCALGLALHPALQIYQSTININPTSQHAPEVHCRASCAIPNAQVTQTLTLTVIYPIIKALTLTLTLIYRMLKWPHPG